MTQLLLASTNPGKVHELRELLGDLEVEVITPQQAGLSLDIEENGATYAQNAAIKAQSYARLARLLTLGDDSGLEVDALGGLPGIRSARFSQKPKATDADRRLYLLQRGVSSENAYQALLKLAEQPGLEPDLLRAAQHLTLRVGEDFNLPIEADLIADARMLCERLAREN